MSPDMCYILLVCQDMKMKLEVKAKVKVSLKIKAKVFAKAKVQLKDLCLKAMATLLQI